VLRQGLPVSFLVSANQLLFLKKTHIVINNPILKWFAFSLKDRMFTLAHKFTICNLLYFSWFWATVKLK